MQGIRGRHFIVTGAGSGIGAATVLRLLNDGADITAGDINPHGLNETRSAAGAVDNLFTQQFDLADETSIKQLVATAMEKFGRLDGVVNVAADVSAGTMNSDVEVSQMDANFWAYVLKVNLIGPGLIIREALPHLKASVSGSIVLVSSVAAWLGQAFRPAYASSKIGLHALARHTARTWGKDRIRCNVVVPGVVITPASTAVISAERRDAMISTMCASRLGRPEDLAAAITFLLSDDASWITAQILSVDGGLVARE